MKYQKVQGFRVYETWSYQTNIAVDRIIRTRYIDLVQGLLIMKPGFCFEPSGPTFKTKSFMRGSCAHDAIYWLIKNGHIEAEWKDAADDLMYELCILDKMIELRAKWCYKAVSTFGDNSIDKSSRMKVLVAP